MACYYGNDAHSVDRKSWFQRQTPDNVVLGLILANVAVFMLWRFADPQFMLKNFTIGRVFGTEFLLKLYLSGAVVGSIFYLVHHAFMALSSKNGQNPSRTAGLGSSGAVIERSRASSYIPLSESYYLGRLYPTSSCYVRGDLSYWKRYSANITGMFFL
ncbi:hypothetical protein Vadar_029080 [Vaccinium darrowii]|uniref:Uncharacterized protein n=1 Tax=Vaccinium darrowii TaxID=229202 RepID=A0ACB7YGJ6_9ERIC|nr:hypothetical protein Vadar_029080 [Vaccinium darrowii]